MTRIYVWGFKIVFVSVLLVFSLGGCSNKAESIQNNRLLFPELPKVDVNIPKGFQSHVIAKAKSRLSYYRDSMGDSIDWNKDIKEITVFRPNPWTQLLSRQVSDSTLANLISQNNIKSIVDSIFEVGILIISIPESQILVWLPNLHYDSLSIDHVSTDHEVGSLIQPFIHTVVLEQQGLSPCFQVYDLPVEIAKGDGNFGINESWTPINFSGTYSGNLYTLKEALSVQLNTTSAYLIKQMGSSIPFRDFLHSIGLNKIDRNTNGNYRVPMHPKISIGAFKLSLLDLVSAYNKALGNNVELGVSNIESINFTIGKVIKPYYQSLVARQEIEKGYLGRRYLMLKLLQNNVKHIKNIKLPIAGMLGKMTTERSGAFIGITPHFIMGIWIGEKKQRTSFNTGELAHAAQTIFINFVKKIETESPSLYDVSQSFFDPKMEQPKIDWDCSEYNKDVWEDFSPSNPSEKGFDEDIFADEIPLDYTFSKKADSTSRTKN